MSLDDRDYMRGDAAEKARRTTGRFGPIEWEVEEVPEGECSALDTVVAGAVGYGVGAILGLSPFGRFLGAAAGAVGARFASSHTITVRCVARPERDDEPEPERR